MRIGIFCHIQMSKNGAPPPAYGFVAPPSAPPSYAQGNDWLSKILFKITHFHFNDNRKPKIQRLEVYRHPVHLFQRQPLTLWQQFYQSETIQHIWYALGKHCTHEIFKRFRIFHLILNKFMKCITQLLITQILAAMLRYKQEHDVNRV